MKKLICVLASVMFVFSGGIQLTEASSVGGRILLQSEETAIAQPNRRRPLIGKVRKSRKPPNKSNIKRKKTKREELQTKPRETLRRSKGWCAVA